MTGGEPASPSDRDDRNPVGSNGDPRLDGDAVWTIRRPGSTVTLVGVVHDHPASVYRAAVAASERDPAVLALELPPVSLPLFEAYADDSRSPPAFGGEMSAAIQATSTDRVVGIDGPSVAFLRELAGTLWRERPPASAVRGVLAGLASATREALVCRAAGAVATRSSIRLEVAGPVEHDCTRVDPPSRQATDEQRQLRRARAVMRALEPSRATACRDAVRETHMADRLQQLRVEGDVVAIVGYGHLESVACRLCDDAPS